MRPSLRLRWAKFDGLRDKLEKADGSTEPCPEPAEGLAEVLKSWLIIFLAITLLPALVMAVPSLSSPPAPQDWGERGAAAQQDPTVRIEPVQSTVTVGESFTVSVMIDNASDLGSFQFDLLFVASVVTVTNVTLGDFLGSTGRGATPLGPEYKEVNKVKFAAYTMGTTPPGPDHDTRGWWTCETARARKRSRPPDLEALQPAKVDDPARQSSHTLQQCQTRFTQRLVLRHH